MPQKVCLVSPLISWRAGEKPKEMLWDARGWRQRAWVRSSKGTEVTVSRSPFDVQGNSSPFLIFFVDAG